MVEVAVTLPESRPEDDEDVVWGLSTASALWARGERADAIVWLRRAADAASAAGQEARATELGTIAVRAEQALEQSARHTDPPPSGEPLDLDRPSLEVQIEKAPPPPLVVVTPGPAPHRPPPPPEAGAAQHHEAAPPRPARTIRPPPAPSAPRAAVTARPPSVIPPAARPPEAPHDAGSHAPAPAALPPSAAPAAHGPAPAAAVVPHAAPPPAAHPPAADAPTPPSPMVAPILANAPAPPPPRAEVPSSYPGTRKTSGPRTPILDPWAEESTLPNLRVDPLLRNIQLEGDALIVQMRQSPPRVTEDDGVITSAAPLEHTLRRVARPPAPPTRKWTATGEQPPGHIADSGTGVVSKAPAAKPRPPAPPAAPASHPEPAAAPPVSTSPPATAPATGRVTLTTPMPIKVAHDGGAAPKPPSQAPPGPTAAPAALSPHDTPTQPTQPSPIPRPRPITVPPPATAHAPAVRITSPTLRPQPAPRAPSPSAVPSPAPTAARAPLPRTRGASVPPPPAPAAPSPEAVRAPVPPAAASPAPPVQAKAPHLEASALEAVEAFADVPPETRVRLAALARVEVLGADEEVSAFGAALIVEGGASVCATIVDEPISRAALGALIPARGALSEAVALRVVAGPGGARVALWDQAPIDEALHACPWVLEELMARADQLQARAGATMGPLGELDEPSRDRVLDRLSVRVARAHEAIAAVAGDGAAVALVCVGSVEVSEGGKAVVVRAGEPLFPRDGALEGKAGAQGAILLVGDAPAAADLAGEPPPLGALFTPR